LEKVSITRVFVRGVAVKSDTFTEEFERAPKTRSNGWKNVL